MRDHQPDILGDGEAVLVWGGACGELAGALDLLAGFLAGRQPPGAVTGYPRLSRRLEGLREACSTAARQQQAARYQELAIVAPAQPLPQPALVAPGQPGGSSDTATISVAQAVELLGVSRQRVNVLCSSGRLEARYGPRKVWQITESSVAAYKDATRRRNPSGRDHAEGHAGDAGRPEYSAAA